MHSRYREIKPYVSKDGSLIRELIHPDQHGNAAQSLAEATIPPGQKTQWHRHMESEELYYVMQGQGVMTLGDEVFDISAGSSIAIMPGTPHCVENRGKDDMVILCCCSPAYSHEDTEILE